MGSGKKDLVRSLQSCLADVQRYIVDAERRDFDTVSYDYAAKSLKEIENQLQTCIVKAEGI
jgi:hypothetical protein